VTTTHKQEATERLYLALKEAALAGVSAEELMAMWLDAHSQGEPNTEQRTHHSRRTDK